jgi:mannitol-1-phosphate 5-dehydrogenase
MSGPARHRCGVFVGFGFGPIQAGLFAAEAERSGRFRRIVVAEVDASLVEAVRSGGGGYRLNIAHAGRLERRAVRGVELLDPRSADGRRELLEALGGATEVATALPSVALFTAGSPSAADLLAEGLAGNGAPSTLVYAAENHNRAAEILEAEVLARGRRAGRPVQFLNTVIGKMSRALADPGEIAAAGLDPIAPGCGRAFLVEAFNHILVTRCRLPGVTPAISVFEEKDDLLPFEEAKLYGHNAVHALLGYRARRRGMRMMAEAAADKPLMAEALAAFLDESGAALTARHGGLDPLFTARGYRAYAEDLLARMTNPLLRDTVERVTRDPRRKLGWNDRLAGTMRIALSAGIEPARFARAAAAALEALREDCAAAGRPADDLRSLWLGEGAAQAEADRVAALVAARE